MAISGIKLTSFKQGNAFKSIKCTMRFVQNYPVQEFSNKITSMVGNERIYIQADEDVQKALGITSENYDNFVQFSDLVRRTAIYQQLHAPEYSSFTYYTDDHKLKRVGNITEYHEKRTELDKFGLKFSFFMLGAGLLGLFTVQEQKDIVAGYIIGFLGICGIAWSCTELYKDSIANNLYHFIQEKSEQASEPVE